MRWWAEIHAPTVIEIDCWPLRWPEAWRRCGHAQRGYCRLRRFLHSRARDRKVNIVILNQLNSLSEAHGCLLLGKKSPPTIQGQASPQFPNLDLYPTLSSVLPTGAENEVIKLAFASLQPRIP